MLGLVWARRVGALIILGLFSAATVLLAMAAPRSVSSDALGSEWQCSKAMFVTTCRPAA